MNKRGQESSVGISFGMIFSIFLIVVFVIVAFIAIRHFLDLGQTTQVGQFYKDLQEKISGAWESQAGESKFKIDLPKKIEKVCFANLTASNVNVNSLEYKEIEKYKSYGANLFLIPGSQTGGLEFKKIEHLNTTKVTLTKNPYCVYSNSTLTIKKEFYDRLVSVE
jgi:hypothetical protein